MAVTASLVQAQAAAAAATASTPSLRPLQETRPVPVVKVDARGKKPAAAPAAWRPTAVSWPAAGTSVVDLGAASTTTAQAPAPVRLSRVREKGNASAQPSQVKVQVFDRKAATRAGVDGLLLALSEPGSADRGGRAEVSVDYSSFRDAYGGDWASRLTLVQLPACALTQPEKAECQTRTPVPTTNDTRKHSLTADVSLPSAPETAAQTSSVATVAPATMLLAATAAASGGAGDFTATPLSPTGTWSAGGSTGDFTWSYPIDTPAVPGGPTPNLALNYSAQSVDGRTAAANNQANWIGDGWSMEPGYVERRYQACSDDMQDGNNSAKNGDLCWGGDNAVLSLNGKTTELVRDDATKTWKLKADDGTKIEKLTGASNDDSGDGTDGSGEYWKVTTVDGTQYFFGLNRLPGWSSGKDETDSAWTVPVFGNQSGEPCHATAFADSWCQQAWRWNLDYVVDTHDNAMAYFYDAEQNYYGRNVDLTTGDSTATVYDRGGSLKRVEYGNRASTLFTAKAPAVVDFTTSERCLSDCGTFDKDHAANWPDVPFDQYCASGTECKDRYSPTFWTRKRLTSISTRVLTGGAYKDVDTWTLAQSFPSPGDGTSPALWLDSITRTGKVDGTSSMAAVTFHPHQLANRVDATHDNLAPLVRNRIDEINTETGEVIGVTYSDPDCTPTDLPTESSNTRRCYPVYWTPKDAPEKDPIKDWFHKYVVTQVLESDSTGGAPAKETDYTYLGGAAWAKSDDEFTKASERTYSEYRGYGRVQVRTGGGLDAKTLTEARYFRGIEGAPVEDSEGNAVTDHDSFAGLFREQATYNGDGGSLLSAATYEPWRSAPTATHDRTDAGLDALEARQGGIRAESTRTSTSQGWRRTALTRTFDSYGMVATISDEGDTAQTGDEQCTTLSYARNTTLNLLSTVADVKTVADTCDQTPTLPDDLVTEARSFYDGSTALGAAPTKGDMTRNDENNGAGNGFITVARAGYDLYGRATSTTDAAGQTTTTSYAPASGEAPTTITVINPLGHKTTTTLDPRRGQTVTEVDANLKQTDAVYDPLGRITKVWNPGRAKTSYPDSPNVAYTYAVSKTAASVATTVLRGDDTFSTSYALYDSLLRPRETQVPAANGAGRVITETFYDTRGQAWKTYNAYSAAGDPSATLVTGENNQPLLDSQIPSITENRYDGAGRTIAQIAEKYGDETWRTTTAYEGDRTTVTPPAGGTATTTVTDALGRSTALIQYAGDGMTQPQSATYGYNKRGLLASVTDADKNTWTYTYDYRGNQTQVDDPDKGTTKTSYDNADRPVTVTDARGVALTTTYDELGRKVNVKQGSTLLSEWTYDTVKLGQLSSATEYDGTQAYKTEVTGYTNAYQPFAVQVTIPSAEGSLQGVYKWTYGFNANTGQLEWTQNPAVGNLAAERVTTTYDTHDLPKATSVGSIILVNNTTYDPFGRDIRDEYGDFNQHLYGSYDYDEQTSRLTRITTDRTVAPARIDDTTYAYDPAGNVTRITTASGQDTAKVTETQCFTTDPLRRITNAWTASDDCSAKPTGTTAPKLSTAADSYWTSYTYSPSGSRLTETGHNVAGDTTKNILRTYHYPTVSGALSHRLDSVTTTAGGATTDTDTYAYDQAGNTKTRSLTSTPQTLTWNAQGHLAQVTEGTKTSKYLYDTDGNRIIRRDSTGTTLYLPGDTEVLLKADGTKSTTRYYSHGDRTIAVRTAGKLSYLFTDALGTATASVDASTQAITRRKTTIFGAPRGTQPTWPGQQGFVGGTTDPDTGLTHLGAREYDPATGRFISVDPLMVAADPQQLNAYTYSDNNPVTFSDPSGLSFLGFLKNVGAGILDGITDDYQSLNPMANLVNWTNSTTYRATGQTISGPVPTHHYFARALSADIRSTAYKLGQTIAIVAPLVTGAYGGAKTALKLARHAKEIVKLASESGKLIQAAKKIITEGRVKQAIQRTGEGCSFSTATLVLMDGGKTKPIGRIRIGDKVESADPTTGKYRGSRAVTAIYLNHDNDLVDLTIQTGPHHTEIVHTTSRHPFWDDTLHTWVAAARLTLGHNLATTAKHRARVLTVRIRPGTADMHNLTVEQLHTYYVVAGGVPVLVHNVCDTNGHETDPARQATSSWTPNDEYSPEAVASRSQANSDFYSIPWETHDLVAAYRANPSMPPRPGNGPGGIDIFRGDNLSGKAARFWASWRDSPIYWNWQPNSQIRIMVNQTTNQIAYFPLTSKGVHNYGSPKLYDW